jgi:DNA-binding MarR family transcriptional regulator
LNRALDEIHREQGKFIPDRRYCAANLQLLGLECFPRFPEQARRERIGAAQDRDPVGQETRLSVEDISQLVDVVANISEQDQCSPSDAVRRITNILSPDSSNELRDRATLAEFAVRLRRLRMRRNELIGAPLFRDPAWDMLLELFAAHESGRKVTVSSLCYASGVPPTTALRQLQRLEKHGLVTRHGDRKDNRRWYVDPTGKAVEAVASMAAMLLEQSLAVDALAAEAGADD